MNARIMVAAGVTPRLGVIILMTIMAVATPGRAATTNVNVTASTTFSPATVKIKPSDTVQWTWTGNNHSTTSNNGLWDSGIHNSPFTFSFTFTNQGNFPYHCSNPSHSSMTGTVTVTNQPPIVTVTNPANNSVFTAPATFTLGATASDPDGAISQVEFFRGNTSLGVDTTSPYGVSVSSLAAGSYTFMAVATGDGGGKTTNSINVTVNSANNPPSVTVTNPVNGAVLNAPATFVIGATASDSDGTVTNVQFFRGTNSIANDSTSPYSAGITNLPAGAYILSAVASDNVGAKATNSINITVNALPTVTITNPPAAATFAEPWIGPLQASVADSDGTIVRVQYFSTGNSLGIVSNAPYTLAVNLLAGVHVLTAVAMDNHGATNTSAPVSIQVVTPTPVVLGDASWLSPSQFQFSYTANTGLTYVVERALDLFGFTPFRTNVASGDNVIFTDNSATNALNYYRVGRTPNP
jgi:plastocyanin